MKNIFRILILVFCGITAFTSCKDDSGSIPEWPWNDNSTEKPEEPDVTTVKPRYVWIDAAANFPDYANSKENISKDMAKIKTAGFTDIIVDVRPTTGDVLFNTDVVDQVKRMDVWGKSGYAYYERTETWDYLQAFIDEAHTQGLKVHASINTFVGGYLCPYSLGSDGVLFRDASKKEWASVANLSGGLTNTMDLLNDETDYGAKFMNPANENVQNFVLQLLGDLAKYELDGIILDRCRYDDYGLESDFSAVSKQKFETYIGQTVTNFPDDIMKPGTESLPSSSSQPTHFKKWLEFRVKVIHDFIVKAREKVKSVNSDIKFGVYVGAWYSSYYASGVNWASPKYDTSAYYPKWATAEYKNYGYADHLDYIFLGAYASTDKIYGSGEWTMEGFCKNGRELLKGDVPFSGGPDIGNSSGWTDGGQAAKIPNAIDACINNSDGFFAFDLCHIKMYDYWAAFKTGFDQYLESIQ